MMRAPFLTDFEIQGVNLFLYKIENMINHKDYYY
jgi:hypothetical protein